MQINPKLRGELRRLHISYNPTNNDMVDCAFIGGTDESYSIPGNFTKTWYHEDRELRNKYR